MFSFFYFLTEFPFIFYLFLEFESCTGLVSKCFDSAVRLFFLHVVLLFTTFYTNCTVFFCVHDKIYHIQYIESQFCFSFNTT